MPDAPGPKAKPNAVRESDTIRALGEVRTRLQQLVNLLSPYQPKQIIDSGGARVQVLALDLGNSPVDEADSSDHPFKVSRRNAGTTEAPVWQAKVPLNSTLLKSLRPNDKQVITGLDTWFSLLTTDLIWLDVVFTPGTSTITSCSIDSLGQGDSFDPTASAWSGSNGYCESDGGTPAKHQTSRVLIATANPVLGAPVITQHCFTNLVLRSVCIDLRAATFPMPSPYGASS